MLKSVVKLALILFLSAAPVLHAGTQTGQVTGVVVRASDGVVFFTMTGSPAGRPLCATGNYWMIRDENSNTGKKQLSILLLARATGQSITVHGSGVCLRWVDGEDVNAIIY